MELVLALVLFVLMIAAWTVLPGESSQTAKAEQPASGWTAEPANG